MRTFNFKCRHCKSSFYEANYSIGVSGEETVFKTKNGAKLKCPYCESEKISSIEQEGEYNINYPKFGSLSDDDKRNVLRKRADKHQKGRLDGRKKYLDKKILGYE